MLRLQTRLRTLLVTSKADAETTLFEEAVAPSLQLAQTLLDAGRRGRHGTLLAVRPLLRALAVGRHVTDL